MINNLVQITPRYTSRSAVLTAFTCKYKRYLQYHYNNYGIVSSNQSLDLLIGTTVHRGLQHLLEHCRNHRPDEQLTIDCINEAVEKAREIWEEALSLGGLNLHSGEEERLDEIIAEQECLWEGLIRAFAIRRLPEILEEYTILEVEKEEIFEDFTIEICNLCQGEGSIHKSLAKDYIFNTTGTEAKEVGFNISNTVLVVCPKCEGSGKINPVIFLGKADGLFLRKSDNKIIQLSIKTASMFPEVTERNIQHDMQGVSEQVCTNARLKRVWNSINKFKQAPFNDKGQLEIQAALDEQYGWFDYFTTCPEVYAVQYEFLIKGQRKQDPYNSGIYKQQSFLCHPYKQDSIMNLMGGSIGFTPTNYKWKPSKGKLPKGWEKININEDIGIQNWVEMLAMGKIQPEEGDPLQTILISPGLIIRLPEEIEEWKISTAFGEEEIARYLDEIETLETYLNSVNITDKFKIDLEHLIWQYFPKNTQSCHNYYGRDCQYVVHCHEMANLDTLLGSGLMQIRRPHHDLEEKSFKEKGFINE